MDIIKEFKFFRRLPKRVKDDFFFYVLKRLIRSLQDNNG